MCVGPVGRSVRWRVWTSSSRIRSERLRRHLLWYRHVISIIGIWVLRRWREQEFWCRRHLVVRRRRCQCIIRVGIILKSIWQDHFLREVFIGTCSNYYLRSAMRSGNKLVIISGVALVRAVVKLSWDEVDESAGKGLRWLSLRSISTWLERIQEVRERIRTICHIITIRRCGKFREFQTPFIRALIRIPSFLISLLSGTVAFGFRFQMTGHDASFSKPRFVDVEVRTWSGLQCWRMLMKVCKQSWKSNWLKAHQHLQVNIDGLANQNCNFKCKRGCRVARVQSSDGGEWV